MVFPAESDLSFFQTLGQKLDVFLKGTIFLDALFHGLQGIQGRCMISVETPADGLKRMVGVLPGEVHGHLPRPNDGLPPGGRSEVHNADIVILTNQPLDRIQGDTLS
jgi:hypothetical protein